MSEADNSDRLQKWFTAADTLNAIKSFVGYTAQWGQTEETGEGFARATHAETGETLVVTYEQGVATVEYPGVSMECRSEDDLRNAASLINGALDD